jgi:hypothetical protein
MRKRKMKTKRKVKIMKMIMMTSMMRIKKNLISTSLKTIIRTSKESEKYVSMMKKYNKTKRENQIYKNSETKSLQK